MQSKVTAALKARLARVKIFLCDVDGILQRKIGRELWTVFVPTTPNPTGGYVLFLPPADIVELDMTIGEGMKLIISGGAFIPPASRTMIWPAAMSQACRLRSQ